MRLFRLLRRESPVSLGRSAGMAAASGFLNAALLGVINYPGREDVRLALFAVAIVLFILAQRYILVSSTVLVETVLNRIRQRLSARIRNADLYPLEQVGRAAVYTNLSKQIGPLPGAASTIIIAIQSSIMVAFAILCLAIISRNAFFLTLLLSAVALSIHFRARPGIPRNLGGPRSPRLGHRLPHRTLPRSPPLRRDPLHPLPRTMKILWDA